MFLFVLSVLVYLQPFVSGVSNLSCDEVEDRVADADKNTVIMFPPPITGKWVSERCESGPLPQRQYWTRAVTYTDNDTYSCLGHNYRDPDCSSPWMSVLFRGKASLRGRSWLAVSAASLRLTVESVVLVAHTQEAADELSGLLNSTCSGLVKRRWKSHTEYSIYISEETARLAEVEDTEWVISKLDCLKPLLVAHKDDGLLRVQVRPPSPPELSGRRTELLLGESRPKGTVFQPPLLLAAEANDCYNCQKVDSSSLHSPALLTSGPAPVSMAGEWVSLRCESRPMGLYLRRRLRVSGITWQADYKFYQDSTCTSPTLTASAEGAMKEVTRRRIPGAIDYDFKVLRAFLTLHDEGLLKSLSQDTTCGPPGSWQLGVRRDLTASGGCPALGIAVPTTEPELTRLELDQSGHALLYLGQSERSDRKQRPTSFQPPLLQCNAPDVPPLTHFLNSFNGATRASVTLSLTFAVLVILQRG